MVKSFTVKHDDGTEERITVDYDPSDVDPQASATITRDVKSYLSKRFKHVESVAIPHSLIDKVCFALGATEWER